MAPVGARRGRALALGARTAVAVHRRVAVRSVDSQFHFARCCCCRRRRLVHLMTGSSSCHQHRLSIPTLDIISQLIHSLDAVPAVPFHRRYRFVLNCKWINPLFLWRYRILRWSFQFIYVLFSIIWLNGHCGRFPTVSSSLIINHSFIIDCKWIKPTLDWIILWLLLLWLFQFIYVLNYHAIIRDSVTWLNGYCDW